VIPNNPEDIEKLKALAKRNDANGDWGDETTVLGVPGETVVPMTSDERAAKRKVSGILAKQGSKKLPKK
jgi:hypothetical protein